ncbi:MAG: hypothetical protein WCW33_01575 [Candidatus Babeliales bacterium]|jgi:hypothetical protein
MKFKLLFLSCVVLIMGSPLQAMEWTSDDEAREEQRKIDDDIDRAERENRDSNQIPQATAIDDSPIVPASAKPLTKQQLKRAQKRREQEEAEKMLELARVKKQYVANLALQRQPLQPALVEEKKEASPEATALKIEACKNNINAFIGNALHLTNSYQVGLLADDQIGRLIDLRVIDAGTNRSVFLKARVEQFVSRNNDPKALEDLRDLLYSIEDRLQTTFKQKAIQAGLEAEAMRAKEKLSAGRKQRKAEAKKHANPKVVRFSEFSDGVTQHLTDVVATQLDETISRLADKEIRGQHDIVQGCYGIEILHFVKTSSYRIYFRRDVVINGSSKLVLLLFEPKGDQGGIAVRADGVFRRFCASRAINPDDYKE